MTLLKASPTKLRNGDWGAKVLGTVTEGDTVTITTRAGKSWDAKVTKVLWTKDGVAICATESLDRTPKRRRSNGCDCDCYDCKPYCRCEPHCNCRGGNIYDCG